jgi:hypothetical protein
VGVGTTSPSTYGSAQKILAVQGSSGSVAGYIASVSSDATRSIGLYSGLTSADNPSVIYTGDLRFGSATSTNAVTGYSEKMRIDSSGNLLVGQTTAAVETGSIVTAKNLEITRTIDSDGGALGQLSWVNNTNAGVASGTSFAKDVACIKGLMDGTGNNSGGYLIFETKADAGTRAEAMRINSIGKVGVNTSGAAYGGSVFRLGVNDTNYCIAVNATGGGTTDMIDFYSSGTFAGKVSSSGATTAYNTSSDYRLKEVIGPVSGAGARIDALKPIDYQWKDGNQHARGFLAHEFQEVYPSSVSGNKDAIDKDGKPAYQSMQASTSEVIADLVAEIQSLRKRLAAAGI